jgi:hypothetical protein
MLRLSLNEHEKILPPHTCLNCKTFNLLFGAYFLSLDIILKFDLVSKRKSLIMSSEQSFWSPSGPDWANRAQESWERFRSGEGREERRIPKILHFIWLGHKKIPELWDDFFHYFDM